MVDLTFTTTNEWRHWQYRTYAVFMDVHREGKRFRQIFVAIPMLQFDLVDEYDQDLVMAALAAVGQKKFTDEVMFGSVPTESQEDAVAIWVEAREINRYIKAAKKVECEAQPEPV